MHRFSQNLSDDPVVRAVARQCLSPFTLLDGRDVRCRKCAGCRRQRMAVWSARGYSEGVSSPRTWFATLTFAGDRDPGYSGVQGFLKQARKLDPLLRYMCTEETGSRNGRRHWHLLIHCAESVQRRDLEALWPHGFTSLRLVKGPKLAAYIAKYQGKGGVLRASPRYGKLKVRPGGSPLPEECAGRLVAGGR